MTFTATDVLMIVTAILTVNFGWSIFWARSNARRDVKRREDAFKVLKLHGLSTHLYLAGIGIEDPVLGQAAAFFGDRGHVVMDATNQIVGKIGASQSCIHTVAEIRQAHAETKPKFLTLVVDNTNPS